MQHAETVVHFVAFFNAMLEIRFGKAEERGPSILPIALKVKTD